MIDSTPPRAWMRGGGGLAVGGGAAAANRRVALRRLRESQTPQTAFTGNALERFSVAPIVRGINHLAAPILAQMGVAILIGGG
jgi:hypothetical protein